MEDCFRIIGPNNIPNSTVGALTLETSHDVSHLRQRKELLRLWTSNIRR